MIAWARTTVRSAIVARTLGRGILSI